MESAVSFQGDFIKGELFDAYNYFGAHVHMQFWAKIEN